MFVCVCGDPAPHILVALCGVQVETLMQAFDFKALAGVVDGGAQQAANEMLASFDQGKRERE